ncbi:helix-turn-helix domain-containing protein [Streptomyces sp. MP131-18]|uniref:helix-turn-helix domain-containing protein n=1 Tax=Streptomyces sp. MP131-18 TaxID=1857892 RepID=UPI00097C9BB1|nr:helix-turn-helix domain-containing protein [Streptomyces sp. MP131-18]ONK14206.1 Transcriptional activator NphR [Streptomyces sp. MP131-18]
MSAAARQAGTPGQRYTVMTLATSDVRPHESAEYWAETVTSFHCPFDVRMPRRAGSGFRGRAVRQHSPSHQYITWQSDECLVRRTPRQVRSAPFEDYRLIIPHSGELLVGQAGREARVRRGQAVLASMNAPLEMWQSCGARMSVLSVPWHGVASRLGLEVTAEAVDATSGLGRIVVDTLGRAYQERDHLGTTEFDAVCERAVELLCMVLAGDDRPDPEGHRRDVETAVRHHIRRHAHEPGLNGQAVAHALGWSLRYVQLVLQRVGTTPRDLIREERLHLARARLESPEHRHRSIGDIAQASGFSSVGALSTVFRNRFGLRPSDVRASPLPPAPARRPRIAVPRPPVRRHGGRHLERSTHHWSGVTLELARWCADPAGEAQVDLTDHVLFVTLAGTTEKTEARIEDGQRYDGADFPGAVTFIPAHRRRLARHEGGTIDYAMLRVRPERLHLPEDARGSLEFRGFTNRPDPLVHRLARELRAEALAGSPHGELLVDSAMTMLSRHLVRQHSTLGTPPDTPDATARTATVLAGSTLARVLDHVHDELAGDLRLAHLAEVAGMDLHHFSRAFRAAVGLPPYRYVIEQRIRRAADLLAGSDLPIAEIAHRVGMSSQSHLTTAFRRATGATPKAYRLARRDPSRA